MLNNFTCFKVTEKENDKSPDYRLSAKVGEQWVSIGVGWIKENDKGKFISFQLNKPYQDKPGFEIKMIEGAAKEAVDYPDSSEHDNIPF